MVVSQDRYGTRFRRPDSCLHLGLANVGKQHDAHAWSLDKAGDRVLLVDADPQGSAQIENRRKTISH